MSNPNLNLLKLDGIWNDSYNFINTSKLYHHKEII